MASSLDGSSGLSGKVRRDGVNATDALIALVRGKFREHVRAVLLQGIALAGFNVVDVHRLAGELDVPVVVADVACEWRAAPNPVDVRACVDNGGCDYAAGTSSGNNECHEDNNRADVAGAFACTPNGRPVRGYRRGAAAGGSGVVQPSLVRC